MIRCNFVKDGAVWTCQTCGVPAPYFTGDDATKMFRQCPATQVVHWSGITNDLFRPAVASASKAGPGKCLALMIARFQRLIPWWDMKPNGGCGCHDTARWMDRLGPDGCEEKIDVIVDRLETEAKKRKITFPFRRAVAKKFVRWAIRRARKDMI